MARNTGKTRKTGAVKRVRKDTARGGKLEKLQEPKRAEKAWAIVAQVISHFGAGYAVQRASEGGTVANPQIYKSPADVASFAIRLQRSTYRNLAQINWESDTPGRNAVCLAAFEHGKLARQQVVREGDRFLNLTQLLTTLETIKETLCPPGAGGGRVCDF